MNSAGGPQVFVVAPFCIGMKRGHLLRSQRVAMVSRLQLTVAMP